MRFFPAFASASKAAAGAAFCALAAAAHADFTVTPSTVVAGRRLAVSTRQHLQEGRVMRNGRTAEMYPVKGRWRAILGVPTTERPGPKTLLIKGITAHGEPFQASAAFEVIAGTYPVGTVRMAPSKTAMYTTGLVDRDTEFLAAFFTQPGSPEKMWAGRFVRPSTGIVSSVFGSRRTYADGGSSTPHSGTDIAAPAGSPVRATQGGRVAWAGRLESLGNVVLVDHGHGVYDYFLHMRSLAVAAGKKVRKGQLLGEMGAEGVATGPHVHWSLVAGGERVDPLEWTEEPLP